LAAALRRIAKRYNPLLSLGLYQSLKNYFADRRTEPYDSGGGEYTGEASVSKWKHGSAKENSRNQPSELEISAGTLFT